MQNDLLNLYVSIRLKAIKRQLLYFEMQQHPEALHQLRVDIKKIRAVLSFASTVYHQNFKSKELDKLFNDAGKIRELQINIILLDELPGQSVNLAARLQQHVNMLQTRFVKNIQGYILTMDAFSSRLSLPARLPKKKIIAEYFEKQWRKAGKELESHKEKKLHQSRKRLKNLLYVLDVLPSKLKKSFKPAKSTINLLQQKLGSWHDTNSAIHFFAQQRFPGRNEYLAQLEEKEAGQLVDLYHTVDQVNADMK